MKKVITILFAVALTALVGACGTVQEQVAQESVAPGAEDKLNSSPEDEEVPMIKEEPEETEYPVTVEVTDKINIPQDPDEWRFSDRVEFEFRVTNSGNRSIRGIQGVLTIQDLFGEKILSVQCDFTGKDIPPHRAIPFSDLGLDINEFMDDHVKLYTTDYEDLNWEYEITQIVYED